ncbi:MAG: hypothetical protein CL556_02825 [Alphaproteobacteria bacterium]|nr:hypothetical protein [Alphaproteobacteria bacterium]|tara:strand:+ start:7087 stop:7707 length:621 start_codon:yes stop_codon:yes gene_type:complete
MTEQGSGMTSRRTLLLGGLGLSALPFISACTSSPPPLDVPRMTFQQFQPIRFDVARLEVRNNYQPKFFPPNVEHKLAQPPYIALQDWARRRIEPAANNGEALLVIHNASIVERQLEAAKKLGPFTMSQPTFEYVANFAVRLDAVSPYWDINGFAEARAEGRLVLDDQSTLDQRDRALFDLVERTINDLDREFVSQLQRNLGALISR